MSFLVSNPKIRGRTGELVISFRSSAPRSLIPSRYEPEALKAVGEWLVEDPDTITNFPWSASYCRKLAKIGKFESMFGLFITLFVDDRWLKNA